MLRYATLLRLQLLAFAVPTQHIVSMHRASSAAAPFQVRRSSRNSTVHAATAHCSGSSQAEEHGSHTTCAPTGCIPQDQQQQEAAESNARESLKNLELTAAAEARVSSQQTIRHEISHYPVVLFMKGNASKPACKFSRHALDILKASRVPTIRTVNVLEDPELRAGIKRFSDYPYIPQLYVRGVFIGGLEKLIAMHEDGSLKKCIEG
ncbi:GLUTAREDOXIN, putative [Babesia bigemina]|uniref:GLUTAREDOXIN, putative n=1 Tax=Babesia bigemina TaxID=5866 RepID=A0A061D150_BABBI|nr:GLUTAREDOXIN, putative [Babesia bigemina]CDR94546.1 GLUTAREDOXIN, putative [Babesia bigemina]|eukprot:XP_012766732.1 GLUTAREDOXIN, putative [Babesia bigemina]